MILLTTYNRLLIFITPLLLLRWQWQQNCILSNRSVFLQSQLMLYITYLDSDSDSGCYIMCISSLTRHCHWCLLTKHFGSLKVVWVFTAWDFSVALTLPTVEHYPALFQPPEQFGNTVHSSMEIATYYVTCAWWSFLFLSTYLTFLNLLYLFHRLTRGITVIWICVSITQATQSSMKDLNTGLAARRRQQIFQSS